MKKILGIATALAAALMLASCASTAKAEKKATPAKTEAKATTAATATAAPEHGVIYSGDSAKTSFVLADNHTYGKNFQFLNSTGNVLPKDYKAAAGDVIKLHIEGTASKTIVKGKDDKGDAIVLWCNVVDTSAAGSYWTPLATQYSVMDEIPAGGAFTFDITLTLTKDGKAKAGGSGANVMMGTSNDQKEAVTLTTTKFTYEITRP